MALRTALRAHRLLACAALSLLFAGRSHADDLQRKWQIAPDERDYVTTGNTERGIAYNPVTGHLLLVTRAGGIRVMVLDAKTGDEVGSLDTTDISGGTYALNLIGVADDGVIYAGNLSTSTTAPEFKLYRWENETAIPTVAFDGDPADGASIQRWGDSLDVRGGGTITQVAIGARASGYVAILTPNTDTFTSTLIPNAGIAAGNLGVAFGTGNTLWTKLNGQPLKLSSFDLGAKTATQLQSYAAPLPSGSTAIGVSSNYLGAVAIETPDTFRFYDISDLNSDPVSIVTTNFPADNANLNNTGYVEFGGGMVFALDSNNGLVAYDIVKSSTAEPPVITAEPSSLSVLEGATATFNVGVKGTPPLHYQWMFNGTNITAATNASLALTNVTASAGGNYSVSVQNSAGSVTSTNVLLTITPLVSSSILTPLWHLAPGDRPYIANDNSQRGIAYNPASSNLLVVSRTGAANIWVLNGQTGAEIGKLNTDPSVIFGGTFTLNVIGVSDDGRIYAANLTTDASTSPFNIYRWDSEDTNALPVLVYTGDPSNGSDASNTRFGDTFAVRGSGMNTEILVGARNGTLVSILKPTDESLNEFTPAAITSDFPAGSFGLGLGFGSGTNIFGKGDITALVQAGYDATGGTVTSSRTYTNLPLSGRALAVQSNYLAVVSVETPDNLRLYQLNGEATPTLVDQELFPADNPNINGTGAVAFGPGHLYALDSNNGIIALNFSPGAASSATAATLSSPAVANGSFTFSVAGTASATYKLQSSADLSSWTDAQNLTLDASGHGSVTMPSSAAHQFFRVVAP